MKLENRIVLDAAAGAVADEADVDSTDVDETPGLDPDADHPSLRSAPRENAATVASVAKMLSGDFQPQDIAPILRPGEGSSPMNVVLIANNLPDQPVLQEAAKAESDAIFTYDAAEDDMADVLAEVTDFAEEAGRKVGTLTILSHGGSGFFHLGNETVTADSLEDSAEAWESLQDQMAKNGQIHLYGCNVASEGGSGQALLDGLAELTGASVYASDDVTGEGGDWTLESSSENSESPDIPLDTAALDDFSGVLQDEPAVIFVPPTEIFGREDARSGIVITLFVRDDVNPDQLQLNVTPQGTGQVIRPQDIVQPAAGSQVDYNPAPGQTVPPAGYSGFTWVAFYSPEPNAFHSPGQESPILVSVESTNGVQVDAQEDYTLTVAPLNDAPFLLDGLNPNGNRVDAFENVGTIDIGTVAEDETDPNGVLLSSIINPVIEDVDVGDPTGIAIIGTDVGGGGTWQYNAGGGWVDFGAVSPESALLLASNVQVRFLPQGQWSQDDTEATLDFRAWDQTDGNNSGTTGVNTVEGPRPSQPGDTESYSKAIGTLRVDVTPVNNPPEPPTVSIEDPYIENGFVTPNQVDVPMDLNITLNPDVDDTEFTEVVVEITNGYQSDGRGEDVLFLAGALPSTIQANIVPGQDGVRQVVFTPANNQVSAPIADFQLAVNQLRFEHVGGNELVGPGEDPGALNGDDPIERQRTIQVTVADANASQASNGIQESVGDDDFLVDAVNDGPDAEPETGELVYSLNVNQPTRLALAGNTFTLDDVDDTDLAASNLPRGISEIRVRIDQGYTAAVDELEFNGTGFTDVSVSVQEGGRTLVLTPSNGDAFTLSRAEAVARQVSYVNNAADAAQANEGVDRVVAITVTDNNSGNVGDFFQNQNPPPTQPEFLDGPKSDTVSRTIQIEGDAPPELDFGPGIYEDNGDPTDPFFSPRTPDQVDGFVIQDVIASFNLPNQPPNQGVEALAITAVDDANGQWQFLNSAGQWTPIENGQLGEANALLLGPTDQIRFIPDANFNTDEEPGAVTPTITAKSWDTSEFTGTAGTYVNTVGNNVAFSQEGTGALPVLAVNDRPDIILGPNLDPDNDDVVNEPQRLDQDGRITFTGITLQDIDMAKGEEDGPNPGEIDLEISVDRASSQVFLDSLAGVTIIGGANGSQTVTIRGSLSAVSAAIQTGLRYEANLAELNSEASDQAYDTISITSNDLGNAGLPGPLQDADTIQIAIFPGDAPPDIDLDENDDGGADPGQDIPPAGPQAPANPGTGNFNVFFIEDSDCTPVPIADEDILIQDDNGQIQRMSVELTNRLDSGGPSAPPPEQGGQVLTLDQDAESGLLESLGFDQGVLDALNADPNVNITVNLTQQTNAAGEVVGLTLDFQGIAPSDAYQQILNTVTYDNNSQNPSDTTATGESVRRVVAVTVTDVPQDGVGPGQSSTAFSRIAIIPVNDAPVNQVPGEITVPAGTIVDIGGQLDVGDVEGPAEMSINLGVIFGVLNVAEAEGVQIDGNGTADLTLTGSIEAVNAVLDTLTYEPPANFIGDETLTITSNDFGYEGINPEFVQKNGVRCAVAPADGAGVPIVDDRGDLVPDGTDEGTPFDRDALTDVDTILIRVAESDPDTLPEPPTPPPGPPLQPIAPPDADGPDDLGPGPVNLPGMVGVTGGQAGITARGLGPGGRDFADFCSIEEALRSHLGCRFANTLNPESQFSSLGWGDMTDLGWKPPSLYLDEEYDLYSQLFMEEPGDPGFNVEAGAFGVDLGGLPETPERVFREGQGQETFNEMEPNEIREAFFANRRNLDRTGR
jgi:hypothetical protein